ncbi:SDR family oxidoreductase [Actinomycetospora cinnamomea]|uniref:NADP-dependent 3-hydroxy acid dehydrogenase YdfG n=1 Tax=Actinomycetospora cinnamomea TaxID=663609 RepID=A0A2U1FG40_9PSEU|nr:SDR family oxidoreductase [Actinomycetospora cinnamomea]PVZ11117.1 NADP-dependent 3-hydroxy acid dehydrogenase YdfG [Actinomycetospora cinnamomea]
MSDRTWLVTGASRGLGRALVEAVLAAGDRVVATARDAGTLDDLARGHGDRLLTRDLDVTDRDAVFAVVNQVAAETGRIDVLVANAGYGLAGGVEEVTEEQARRQVEVNLFGALWSLQAVLPTMRAQRRGHLLPISSVGGVGAFPNTGLYHATKWGLEGLSESLAQEVAPFGIRVTIVEPGPFRTDWNGTSMERATPMHAYDDVLGPRRAAMDGSAAFTQPGDPRRAGEAMVRVVDSDDPPRRLLLGEMAADLAPRLWQQRIDEAAAWRDVAVAADFPPDER